MVNTILEKYSFDVTNKTNYAIYKLQKTSISSEERLIGMGILPSVEKSFFNIKDEPDHLGPNSELLKPITLVIELYPDLIQYTRSIYTTLDWLGDVGGLYDAFCMLGSFAIFVYTYIFGNKLDEFLLKRIYKKERKGVKKQHLDDVESKLMKIKSRQPFAMEKRFFHCLRSKKEKRILDKGVDRAYKELDVEHFIRT